MTEFVTAIPLADLKENQGVAVNLKGHSIAIFLANGSVFAISALCPHRMGPLAAGYIEAGKVFCPMHGWDFDLKTGACGVRPERPVECYPVKVVDGLVQVAVPINPLPAESPP